MKQAAARLARVARSLLLSACLCGCATWADTGSIYRSKHTHVGVRPSFEDDGVAITLQVSTDRLP